MGRYDAILQDIDRLVDKISRPLSTSEEAQGWSEEARLGMRQYYVELRRRLDDGGRATFADKSVIRGLDAWGVRGGEMYDDALKIAAAFRATS